MSKKLEKRATRLVRKAGNRALDIRRVVREYGDSIQTAASTNPVRQIERQREIERAVGKYNEVSKALRRLRKKIALKGKATRRSSAPPSKAR
jgi:hypothetical protein